MSLVTSSLLRSFKHFQTNLGALVIELGLWLDRKGSVLSDDVAFRQQLSRHRSLMNINDSKPKVENAWVASSASLVGEVYVDQYASIWFNAVLRAESNAIRIGSYTSIGDGCVLYTNAALPTGVPGSITIGTLKFNKL